MSEERRPDNPLENKLAVIACSAKLSPLLTEGLEALGAQVFEFPVISIREVEDKSQLDAALERIATYAWIVFTSAYSVEFFLQHLERTQISKRVLDHVRICAVGPSTAARLQGAGIRVALVPEQYVAEGVVAAICRHHGGPAGVKGLGILVPRALEAREEIPRRLSDLGARVEIVPCYQNVPPEPSEDSLRYLRTQKPDLVVFTSSSTVRNLVAALGKNDAGKLFRGSVVAALGPITAATLESFGKKADVLPVKYTVRNLLEAIRAYFALRA